MFFLGLDIPSTAYVSSEAVTAVTMHITKIIVYTEYSLISLKNFLLRLLLGMIIVLGSWTGRIIIRRLPQGKFMIVVEILLIICGLQLIFFSK